jgi:hypothetical protein
LLYRYALPLYRHAADAGDRFAASRLADLLAEHRLNCLQAEALFSEAPGRRDLAPAQGPVAPISCRVEAR